MRIKIIEVDIADGDELSLADCGFQVGDIVDVSGKYKDGSLSVQAIRDTDLVTIGNEISLQEGEYEVIEE
ncbi:methyltransferase [Escherichia phage TR2]|nr:methyltransferase [Escherichia phage TR1]UXQ90333.1 methyltransferase [Escherichia phage TR2]WDS61370.1 methyltransferase type 11 [Escherichia phage CY1_Cui-2023]